MLLLLLKSITSRPKTHRYIIRFLHISRNILDPLITSESTYGHRQLHYLITHQDNIDDFHACLEFKRRNGTKQN